MRTVLTMVLVATCGLHIAISEESADSPARAEEVAFIANTNGTFHVATFDPDKRVLLRWNGVQVQRHDLPKASIRRSVRIYEMGERPVYDRNSPEALNPPPEYYHHYGPLPAPIEDIDPPVEARKTGQGEVFLGFFDGRRFYAVTNLGAVATSDRLRSCARIIHISIPENRADEIRWISEGARLVTNQRAADAQGINKKR